MIIKSKKLVDAIEFLGLIFLFLGDITIAINGLILLGFIYWIFVDYLICIPFWYIGSAYIILCILFIIWGYIHYVRWHFLRKKVELPCHCCGTKVWAERKKIIEAHAKVTPLAGIRILLKTIRLQIYRPIFLYTCPTCGHIEYICPYCHKQISKDDRRCPHCGKKNVG